MKKSKKRKRATDVELIGIAVSHEGLVHWMPWSSPNNGTTRSTSRYYRTERDKNLRLLKSGSRISDTPSCQLDVYEDAPIQVKDRRATTEFSRVTCCGCIANYDRGFI
jgi:hypothetical protein